MINGQAWSWAFATRRSAELAESSYLYQGIYASVPHKKAPCRCSFCCRFPLLDAFEGTLLELVDKVVVVVAPLEPGRTYALNSRDLLAKFERRQAPNNQADTVFMWRLDDLKAQVFGLNTRFAQHSGNKLPTHVRPLEGCPQTELYLGSCMCKDVSRRFLGMFGQHNKCHHLYAPANAPC